MSLIPSPARRPREQSDRPRLAPIERGLWAVRSDFRRWLLVRALSGPFTRRDIHRELPAVSEIQSWGQPAELARVGILRAVRGERGVVTYRLGDLAALRALHAWLGDFLARADAAQEAHHDA